MQNTSLARREPIQGIPFETRVSKSWVKVVEAALCGTVVEERWD